MPSFLQLNECSGMQREKKASFIADSYCEIAAVNLDLTEISRKKCNKTHLFVIFGIERVVLCVSVIIEVQSKLLFCRPPLFI